MINFEKKVLGNGLRVVLAPMNNTEAVTLLVLVGVGSRYETKKINGISHFLEHMFFKGTKSRPEPGFKEEEVEKERNVIFQEIDMRNDNTRLKTQENLENIVFGDQPVGWDIAGSKKTVASLKRAEIINYEAENYLSENMTVVAAGNFDKEKVFAKISRAFGPVKKGKNKSFIKAK